MPDLVDAASGQGQQEQMHAVYRAGGKVKQIAPHVVYRDSNCPHEDCKQPLQAIHFRLEDHGRAVYDALVKAWWADVGFVGKCPSCRGWIHFTIQKNRAISEQDASSLPQLPDDWFGKTTVL